MKLFTQFIDSESVTKKLKGYEHVDFSLFHQCIPKSQEELSSINIIVLTVEPNEYFGMNSWVLEHKDIFSIILTWDDKILNTCDNALFTSFGSTIFTPDQYNINYPKTFQISHLCGNLLKSYNQSMRHEILDRKDEFIVPTNFYKTIGQSINNTYTDDEDRRKGKLSVFSNSMYGIAIENFSHRGYFTEKIVDLFLLKTIPIYHGCANIGDFFNIKGIIEFKCVDDLIHISNQLTEDHYSQHLDIIEENYQKALQYVNYEQNIIDIIKKVFTQNKIYESL